MSKNQRSMPKNVLATLTLAGMMLGAVVTPVMAAPGDFYDTTTKIHYSYPLSDAAKANIISVYAKGDSLISEKAGPKYLDYNSAYNLFSTQILGGATADAAILAVAADTALYLNFDPTKTTNFVSVSSVSAINVTTVAGTAPTLPATVTATMSDGTTTTPAVTWAAVTASQYAAAGTFTVSGTVAGTTIAASATVTVNPVSVLQIVGTPKANLVLGNLSVTVNDATKVAKVMVNGAQVSVTPLGNVYTVPIAAATDYVVFVATDGTNVVAQGVAPAAPALTASSKTYNGLLGFESVTVNNSALVASVTVAGTTINIGTTVSGISANVVNSTTIAITGLTAAPATVILVPTSGTSVTI